MNCDKLKPTILVSTLIPFRVRFNPFCYILFIQCTQMYIKFVCAVLNVGLNDVINHLFAIHLFNSFLVIWSYSRTQTHATTGKILDWCNWPYTSLVRPGAHHTLLAWHYSGSGVYIVSSTFCYPFYLDNIELLYDMSQFWMSYNACSYPVCQPSA